MLAGFLKSAACMCMFSGTQQLIICIPLCTPGLLSGWVLSSVNSAHAAVSRNIQLQRLLVGTGAVACCLLLICLLAVAQALRAGPDTPENTRKDLLRTALFYFPDASIAALCAQGVYSLRKVASWRRQMLEYENVMSGAVPVVRFTDAAHTPEVV
jgi:hypothetical protein